MFKSLISSLSVIILLSVTNFVNAVTLPVTVNADSKVTATPVDGGDAVFVDAKANVVANLNITWTASGSTADYELKVEPKNTQMFTDTTFTVSVGQWWNDNLNITLNGIPLPDDTAYVPIRVNVDANLKIVPIQMISGGLPSQSNLSLTGGIYDTLRLPVKTDIITPIVNSYNNKIPVSLRLYNGLLKLNLSNELKDSKLSIYALNGKEILKRSLNEKSNVLLISDKLSNGVYILNLFNFGKKYSFKFNYQKGMNALISLKREIKMHENKNRVRTSEAKYRFELDAVDDKYNDTIIEVALTGQMNDRKSYYLKDPNDTSTTVVFEELLDSIVFEELFKHRYGTDPDYSASQPGGDFFVYSAFKEAIKRMSDKRATVYRKEGLTWGEKVEVEDISTGKTHTYVTSTDYESHTGAETSTEVEYRDFLAIGNEETKKLELAAYLANISHETTGGWPDAPDGPYAWGLFYKEEAGCNDQTTGLYVDANHAIYPPVGSNSYHGRGPKQLSWNYNYGQFSEFLYFDKQVLLNDPTIVSNDPVISVMSSIWFWMTPQGKKPSCHDVMTDIWVPNAEDISKGRDKSKFGMTVNIINGGLECGGSDGDSRVTDRIGYYKTYCEYLGVIPEDYCDCGQMQPY